MPRLTLLQESALLSHRLGFKIRLLQCFSIPMQVLGAAKQNLSDLVIPWKCHGFLRFLQVKVTENSLGTSLRRFQSLILRTITVSVACMCSVLKPPYT